MSSSRFPAWLDPNKFADQQKVIDATLSIDYFERLREQLHSSKGEIHCKINGERDENSRKTSLHVAITGEVEMICQGCNEPFMQKLERQATLYPVYSEEQMKNVADDGEPVLVEDEGLDIKSAVEDEIMLSLPLIPLMEACEELDTYEVGDLPEVSEQEAEQDNPFAALKNLKLD
ncbi:MAG: DUF177 domain-containing protein [Kangiellaceae bacterium]|nr:DUF177 domain-containing protein [Kangiellaceae bacterium]